MPFLRRPKYDLVVTAVRYARPGRVDWVRAYERRGATWSDQIILPRAELVARIQDGTRAVTGDRVKYLAGTFNTGPALHLDSRNGEATIKTAESGTDGDDLTGVPVL